jgi:hypothetical protein
MATIIMSADKVIEAAEKTIAFILAKRKTKNEKAINRRMADKTFSWRKGFYFMNREQAINWLDNNSYFGWESQYAWQDLENANKLLLLAKYGNPVTLNEEDTRILFGWQD